MVLTRASIGRTLARLGQRDYTTKITSIDIITSDHRDQEIKLGPGLTVLCGGNGAGKSTTLGALWRCLTSSLEGPTSLPPVPPWMSLFQVEGTYKAQEWVAAYEPPTGALSGSCPAPVIYLDAAASTEILIARFRGDDNPDDLIEGIDPSVLHADLTEMLSLMLRRQYDAISVYEVTSFSEDDIAIPFFTVSSVGRQYGLVNMGKGELCAFYIIWQLSQLEPGSIVLIEEPESHLATYSQGRILDMLVHFAVERDLTIVASSHSPGLFQSLPNDHTVLVSNSPLPNYRVGISTAELAEHLGLDTPFRVLLVVVEDRAAASFLRSLIWSIDRIFLRRIAITYAQSGESGVRRVTSEVQYVGYPSASTVIGILDGDLRTPAGGGSVRSLNFLPGDAAPEIVLRKQFDKWRRAEPPRIWEPSLVGGSATLQMELERVDGSDHHDWLYEIASRYGGIDVFMAAAVELAIMDPLIREQSSALLAWLRGLI